MDRWTTAVCTEGLAMPCLPQQLKLVRDSQKSPLPSANAMMPTPMEETALLCPEKPMSQHFLTPQQLTAPSLAFQDVVREQVFLIHTPQNNVRCVLYHICQPWTLQVYMSTEPSWVVMPRGRWFSWLVEVFPELGKAQTDSQPLNATLNWRDTLGEWIFSMFVPKKSKTFFEEFLS